jgi:putative ABC transport system ATP-binding protein
VHALKGIDAVIPAGSVTAVVGPSGSGKSTLLRILAALDPATAGDVTIAGRDLAGLSARQLRRIRHDHVGYVFQRPSHNLIVQLTARQHLAHAARLRRVRADPGPLLDLLGIARRADHRPAELSGGEQQRLAFAQAVVGDPALVIADEPTAELDSSSGRALLTALTALAQRGSAIVVSTHDPAVTAAADRVLTLRHGALLAETADGRSLSIIDHAGRIQLPAEALAWFPDARAHVQISGRSIRITPPDHTDDSPKP